MKFNRLPKPLLRVLSALLLWIGVTFTVVPSVGAIIATYKWRIGDTTITRLTTNPPLFVAQQILWACAGIAIVVVGYRIGKATGLGGLGELHRSEASNDRKDLWRAITRPVPEDRPNLWTIDFDIPREEVERHLRELPQLPFVLHHLTLLPLDGREPAASIRGDQVRLVSQASQILVWKGILSTAPKGRAILKGKITPGILGPTGLYFSIFQWCFNGILLLMGSLVLFGGGIRGIPILAPLFLMYLFNRTLALWMRWTVRQEERHLEALFRERLDAASIHLTPQVELLSLDWLKNFWKSR